MNLFIISLAIVFLCGIGVIYASNLRGGKAFGETFIGLISLIIGVIMTLVGLVVVPLVKEYEIEFVDIENYILIKSEEAMILDLANSPQNKYPGIFKFESYRAVTEINDSTRFFMEINRSFYGMNVSSKVVWSNPPYENYNIK